MNIVFEVGYLFMGYVEDILRIAFFFYGGEIFFILMKVRVYFFWFIEEKIGLVSLNDFLSYIVSRGRIRREV